MAESVRKRIPSWVQAMLGIAILTFLVANLISRWGQVQAFDWHFRPLPLIAAMGLFLVYMVGHGLLWTWMVQRLNVPLSFRAGARMFLTSQMAKYIPGGVWPFATLSVSGQQRVLPSSLLVLTYVLHMILIVWVDALFALPVLPRAFSGVPFRIDLVVAFLLILSIFVGPWMVRKSIRYIARWRQIPDGVAAESLTTYATLSRLIPLFVALHVLLMLSFMLYLSSLVHLSLPDTVYAGLAWSGAWLVGFLVLVVPSGLGVREATLTVLLEPVLAAPVAAAVALGFRFFTTVADLIIVLGLYGSAVRIKRK